MQQKHGGCQCLSPTLILPPPSRVGLMASPQARHFSAMCSLKHLTQSGLRGEKRGSDGKKDRKKGAGYV